MIHQKDGGQVGKTISHYPAFRDPVRRDKILEKLRPKECRQVGENSISSLIKKYDKLILLSRSSLMKKLKRLIP